MSKQVLDYGSRPKRKHQVTTMLFWIVALPLLILLLFSFIGRMMGK